MTDGIQRDLGRLEAQVASIAKTLDQLDRDVKQISTTLAEARGGWRMMMLISGASATIGGLVVKFLPWFTMGPR